MSDIHTAALTSVAALAPVFGNEAAVHCEGSTLSDIHTAARALLFRISVSRVIDNGAVVHYEGSALSDIHTAALTIVIVHGRVPVDGAAVHNEGTPLSDIHTTARAASEAAGNSTGFVGTGVLDSQTAIPVNLNHVTSTIRHAAVDCMPVQVHDHRVVHFQSFFVLAVDVLLKNNIDSVCHGFLKLGPGGNMRIVHDCLAFRIQPDFIIIIIVLEVVSITIAGQAVGENTLTGVCSDADQAVTEAAVDLDLSF